MKVLKVFGDGDYGATHFENQHGGTPVNEIIANINNYLPTEENDQYEQWTLAVKEFDVNVNKEFIDFIKNEMIDYENSKHITFYAEGDTV